jgi:hypothetical protein
MGIETTPRAFSDYDAMFYNSLRYLSEDSWLECRLRFPALPGVYPGGAKKRRPGRWPGRLSASDDSRGDSSPDPAPGRISRSRYPSEEWQGHSMWDEGSRGASLFEG